MFTLYNQPGVEEPRQVSLGRFGRILTAHQENLSRVVHHYRRAHHSVRSNHLLVRILQTLPSGEGLDLNQYRNLVEDYTDELTRALDLSSPINVGSAQSPGPFFLEKGWKKSSLSTLIHFPWGVQSAVARKISRDLFASSQGGPLFKFTRRGK